MKDHNNILEGEENGSNKEQKLEGNAREENERLKLSLSRVVKDYQTNFSSHIEENEESELVSLSLGISSKGQPIMDEKKNNTNREKKIKEDGNLGEGLALGLNIKFHPLGNGDKGKEEEPIAEKWPPSKVLKTTRTGDISEASQHAQPKKARVCIRARCDTQTMNDGCHWRKYGQKMAKGNPCPRAYYRCTVSPSCPVRKQVQRCAEDMSILITTYEGTHDHPLPTSANAIAYTTSAAASMLQSPSLSSQQGLANSNSTTFPIVNSDVAYNLYALNYTSPTMINHQLTSRPQQLYLNNSSNISSSSNYHPTITLDLTTPQTNSSFHIGKFPPTPFSSTPKHSSTTNFNVSPTITPLQSSMLTSTWSPYSGCFNYGGLITAQNRNQYGSLMKNEKQPIFQGHLYQPNYIMSNHVISQQPLTNSIATTTKTITTNPKFQSALAAALTTCVDGNATTCDGVKENHVVVESAPLSLKLGEGIPYTKDTVYSTSSQNGIGCESSKHLSNMSNMFKFPPSQSSKSSFGSPSNKSNQLLEEKK